MSETIPEDPPLPVIEPATWYEITVRDENADCPNYTKVFPVAAAYSNGGQAQMHVVCGVCGQEMRILTAVRLDPQPEVT